jgi:hypothetical protein
MDQPLTLWASCFGIGHGFLMACVALLHATFPLTEPRPQLGKPVLVSWWIPPSAGRFMTMLTHGTSVAESWVLEWVDSRTITSLALHLFFPMHLI